MPDILDMAKQAAWAAYLQTVRIRYVPACRCSSCGDIRLKFEQRYTGKQLAGRLARTVAVVVLATLSLCATAHASTYYVTPSGGQGGCSTNSASPQTGLNNGIACLSGGDTLVAKSGVYGEVINASAIPNGTSGAKTTVRSEVIHGAILRPSGGGVRFVQFWEYNNQQWIVIDGFSLDGVNASAPVVGIDVRPNAGTDNLVLQNMELKTFAGWDSCAVTVALSAGGVVSNVVFRNVDVRDIGYNQPPGSTCNCCYSYGVYMSGSGYTLEQSRMVNISGYGVHGYTSGVGASNNTIRNNYFESTGATSVFLCQHDNKIYNNIIVRAGQRTGPGIELASSCAGQPSYHNLIANNTVVSGSGECISLGATRDSIAQNNICYQNGNDAITGGGAGNTVDTTNLLGVNPLFVNQGAGDYHVQSGSQAIGTGATLSSLFTDDFSGATRAGAWSRGAYQFGAVGGLPKPGGLPRPTNLRAIAVP